MVSARSRSAPSCSPASSSGSRAPTSRCCRSACLAAQLRRSATSRRSRCTAGSGLLFFFLILFLQQVAGYSALEAGTASLPVTLVMFSLSTRFGALADRHGPRFFMGVGPLVTAVGLALFLRLDADVDYLTDLLPALLVFALGLSMTVAPLTATVLADADEGNAGVASGVNNAIARVAGLIAIAGVGAVVASSYGSSLEDKLGPLADRPSLSAAVADAKRQPLAPVPCQAVPRPLRPAVEQRPPMRRCEAFHMGVGIAAVLVAFAGLVGLAGSRTRAGGSRPVNARVASSWGCPREGARSSPCDWSDQSAPPAEPATAT